MAIFTKPCERWYMVNRIVLHHWRDIKCAWERANKGYCFRDLWAIDDWFTEIFPKMLREFKENKHGYPVGMTPDEWDEILEKMATLCKDMEERDDYDDSFYSMTNEERAECYQLEYDRQIKAKDDFFELFQKYFFNLWD